MFYLKDNCLIYLNNITSCRKYECICKEKSFQSESVFNNDTEQHIKVKGIKDMARGKIFLFLSNSNYFSRNIEHQMNLKFSFKYFYEYFRYFTYANIL